MISPKNLIRKTIDLTEYGEITLPANELSFLSEQEFQPVCETLSRLVTVSLGWGGDHLTFKAGSNVGVIQTHGLRVQVRPVLSVREMVVLIRYALSGKVPLQQFRSFADVDWGTGFEDVLCMLLCEEAREILRIGLSRRYEERREPLRFLRGRPLWEKNFPWRGGKASELTCRYHRLTYDNTDNRLLLAGLRSASHLANSEEVKGKVFQHIKTFGDLASETTPDPSQFDQATQRYNRLTEHYCAAHGLGKMLIYSLRPESLYDSGKHLVFGVVLDMAMLFEKFIEQLKSTGRLDRTWFPDESKIEETRIKGFLISYFIDLGIPLPEDIAPTAQASEFAVVRAHPDYYDFVERLIRFSIKFKVAMSSVPSSKCAGALFMIATRCQELGITVQKISKTCSISTSTFKRYYMVINDLLTTDDPRKKRLRKKLKHLFKKYRIPLVIPIVTT